ncbi:hypothetical protein [Bosea thiooxidans]|uniref:hypothetical protein n=1 Tax=Bosea thiooxidans TaxID=53254 RepID=UPI0020BFC0BF|nr:hypothetical protein [Bosea thiooxidans]
MIVSAVTGVFRMARPGRGDDLRVAVTVMLGLPAHRVFPMAVMPMMAVVGIGQTHSLFLGTAAEDIAGQHIGGEHFGGREGRHFATGNL